MSGQDIDLDQSRLAEWVGQPMNCGPLPCVDRRPKVPIQAVHDETGA